MLRSVFAAAAVTAGVVIVGSAHAAPIDLTDPSASATVAQILAQSGPDAGKFIVWDKLFMINTFTPGAGSPAAFQAANVSVVGRNNGVDGAGFRLLGQWADFPGDASAFGFVFDYNVSILPAFQGQFTITGVNLAFNGAASGAGSVASVDETVFQGATLLGNPRVVSSGDGTDIESAMISVPSTLSLNAIKDFKVFAPTAGGFATVSFIEQTFKQTQVPAPATAGLALLGLGVIGRRRR